MWYVIFEYKYHTKLHDRRSHLVAGDNIFEPFFLFYLCLLEYIPYPLLVTCECGKVR